MDTITAITVFESLASSVRLDVYRLLVKAGQQGLVVSEIAALLQLPPKNLSFHLKALTQSGLLSVTQEGRFLRYRANMGLMQELIAYMTEECCAGQPDLCFDSTAINSCC